MYFLTIYQLSLLFFAFYYDIYCLNDFLCISRSPFLLHNAILFILFQSLTLGFCNYNSEINTDKKMAMYWPCCIKGIRFVSLEVNTGVDMAFEGVHRHYHYRTQLCDVGTRVCNLYLYPIHLLYI